MFARVTLAAIIAMAPTAQSRVVSADPVDYTPHVLDGIVNTIVLVGQTVVVGGSFTEVADSTRSRTYERDNLFAFDLASGRVLPFAPEIDGPVYGLAAGADDTVYVGGDFPRPLARIGLADGQEVPGFDPPITRGTVTTLARQGSQLYVGGDFTAPRTALARLDAATGALDQRFDLKPGSPLTPRTKVYALAVHGDRLVVDGSFTTLGGKSRPQLGVVDTTTGKVADWRTEAYTAKCMDTFPSYVRGVDISPDGRYFVVVSTGGPRGGATKLCDSAARFETYAKGQQVAPTWVNKTGGDSLYAVSVTGAAVYVGGHQRWMNNPQGHDSAGPGAVPREGIAAIDPRSGKALSWNPGRERGIGVKAFLAHSGGLLVGSDTTRLGGEYHARIGMFPLP